MVMLQIPGAFKAATFKAARHALRRFTASSEKQGNPSEEDNPIGLCSLPERRRGDEALTDIPIEIYYAILEEVIPNYAFASSFDKRTLGSLSLVCRFFRRECQFRQFEILTFPLMKTWFVEKSHPRSQWMSALQRGDSRAKQLAKHVLTCSLSLPNNPRRQGLAYSIKLSMRSVRKPEGYLSALSTFTHLQYLTLFSYPISMTLLQAIATLPELSSLCWFGCPRVIGKPTRLELSGRGICMFDFIQCSADASALALFLSPILQLLDIQGLQRLATDVPSLLAAVFEAETETEIELEELEVQCRDPGAIAAAERNLHRWPQLAALSMHYSCPLFAPAIVPNLTSLSCLVDTAAAFLASNRPISKLTILESGGIELEDHIPNLIRAITPSRPVQLTHLSIPLDAFMCFPPAWTLSVRELTVVIPERGFERPAADIGEPMRNMRFIASRVLCTSLTFVFPQEVPRPYTAMDSQLDLVSQRRQLHTALPDVFPQLREMHVGSLIAWRKISEDLDWRPRVSNKEQLRLWLEGVHGGQVYDVDDCVISAFLPGELEPSTIQIRHLTRELQDELKSSESRQSWFFN